MQWDGYEGCYFNQLYINQIKKLLFKKGLSKSKHKIYSQESGQKDENINLQTIIEIKKITTKLFYTFFIFDTLIHKYNFNYAYKK
jgi:hypothetical protein